MSKEMMVVVDETKRVHQLGTKKLPVEIIPFAYKATLHALSKEGLTPQLRTGPSSAPYVTDNGNYIADIYFSTPPKDPEQLDIRIKEIPGVVETGFFFHLAGRVIVAFLDGQTSILS